MDWNTTPHAIRSPRSGAESLPAELTVRLYCPHAPASGRAQAWVRNRNVHVLVVAGSTGSIGSIRSRNIVGQYTVATRVDSRYDGPRSAYGQAIAEAEVLAERLARGLCC
jgi:hypothetical protein